MSLRAVSGTPERVTPEKAGSAREGNPPPTSPLAPTARSWSRQASWDLAPLGKSVIETAVGSCDKYLKVLAREGFRSS